MAIRITIAHITIKVFEVIGVFDGFSCDLEIGLWTMVVFHCKSSTRAGACGALLSEQRPNSPHRIFTFLPQF